MRKIVIILSNLALIASIYGQSPEKLSGKFEYNQILNSYLSLSENEMQEYKRIVENLDTALINQYFEIIFANEQFYTDTDDDTDVDWDSIMELEEKNYQKADSLLSTDSFLSGMEARMIALLYTENELNRIGLRDKDYYAISQDTISVDGTVNVFLTKEQYEKLKGSMDNQIEINVQFITEVKWTKFRVYMLKD